MGQLGDGSAPFRSLEPSAVAGGPTSTSLDAGLAHTSGRTSTGTVYCWGANGGGQLGTNTSTTSPVPVKAFGQP